MGSCIYDHRYRKVVLVGFLVWTSATNLLQSLVHQTALSFERLLYFGTCRKANSHYSAIAAVGMSTRASPKKVLSCRL